MKQPQQGEFRIESEGDIVMARKLVRETATSLGFGITDVTRIVTAASEMTRNIYQYAGSGCMYWRTLNQGSVEGLELTFVDHGPGIADLTKAMQPGFSTGRGLGMGLPGAKRLMDEMTVESKAGQGTKVGLRKWLKK